MSEFDKDDEDYDADIEKADGLTGEMPISMKIIGKGVSALKRECFNRSFIDAINEARKKGVGCDPSPSFALNILRLVLPENEMKQLENTLDEEAKS